MNSNLRDRIVRKLDTLSDERGYQVLDYVDFLESRYAEKAATPVSLLQRFTEGVEDRLRTGNVAASTVAETMGLLNKAVGVLGGVAAAGMSVATDVASVGMAVAGEVGATAQRMVTPPGGPVPGAAGASPAGPQPPSGPSTGTPPAGGAGGG
jgi:hypothetical protein